MNGRTLSLSTARASAGSPAAAACSPPTSTGCSKHGRRCRSWRSSSARLDAKASTEDFPGCMDKEAQVGKDQAEADGGEKAPLLPPRGGRRALAARRPLYRAPRVLRPDDRTGPGQDRRGQSEEVAAAGRTAKRGGAQPVEAGGNP